MTDDLPPIRTYSKTAWDIASRYSDVLASETRDLAAAIDEALAVRDRERISALTKIAAECHRAKWEFDLSEDYRPSISIARGLILKAFDKLHKIGDEALKIRDELRTHTRQPVTIEGTSLQ